MSMSLNLHPAAQGEGVGREPAADDQQPKPHRCGRREDLQGQAEQDQPVPLQRLEPPRPEAFRHQPLLLRTLRGE